MALRIFSSLGWLISLALVAEPAFAQWNPLGVPVCEDSCVADRPMAIPDGAGGAFIAWRDGRARSTAGGGGGARTDVYAQRLTSAGTISQGWIRAGVPVCNADNDQGLTSIASDGQGGLLVAWQDLREPGAADIYAQRVMADGSIAPGWPINGAPATRGPNYQDRAVIAPDGAGGAYVAWMEEVNVGFQSTFYIFAQHLTATGGVSPGWPSDGLSVCNLVANQPVPYGILPDGAGGVVLAWNDNRSGGYDVYAQHLLADGSIAPGWVANGLLVARGRLKPHTAPDGAGGFYVVCSTIGTLGFDRQYYVQRFTFTGTRSPGWPESGVLVCGAASLREGLRVVPDGVGGVLLTWYDYRPSPAGSEIYAQRVMPDGSLGPGWTPDGTRVSEATAPDNEFEPTIASDGSGGAYIAWEQENYEDPYSGQPSYVQHLMTNGAVAPGWPQYGFRLAPTIRQAEPQAVEDGSGGAIVVWRELRVYAQRFAVDGPVAVKLSLVSAEAKEGRVVLDWFAARSSLSSATISRRTETSSWTVLGSISADGTGHLRYEDRDVSPGQRYGYRLGYLDGGIDRLSAETWVDVPALSLALHGLRPNPASGPVTVSFALPDASPASLEVLDVGGRRIVQREVGSLGPGNHLVRLDDGTSFAPGIYWLRLRQGARALLARGVVVR